MYPLLSSLLRPLIHSSRLFHKCPNARWFYLPPSYSHLLLGPITVHPLTMTSLRPSSATTLGPGKSFRRTRVFSRASLSPLITPADTFASSRIIPQIPDSHKSMHLSMVRVDLSPSAIMPTFGREVPSSSRLVSMQVSHSAPTSTPQRVHLAPTRYALVPSILDDPPIFSNRSVSTIHALLAIRSPASSDLRRQ